MSPIKKQKKHEAIRSLINMAVIEGMALCIVIAVYFYTDNITYLVGGIVGIMFIFGPMFFRWARTYKSVWSSKKPAIPSDLT